MREGSGFPWVVIVLAAAVVGGWLWLRAPAPPPAVPPVVQAPPPEPPPAQPPDAAPPGIRHPIKAEEGGPRLADSDAIMKDALTDLLGRKTVRSFLNVEDFARRFVATADNLARSSAAPSRWPVKPTPGVLTTEPGAEAESAIIAARNAERYTPLVRLLTALDTQQMARFYRRHYLIFQEAYEDLGYPGQYFNDRLVEVIDHLLAAPIPEGPIAVRRLDAGGMSNVYVFADEERESLTAGHKILLRIGADNAAHVREKLTELRAQVVSSGP